MGVVEADPPTESSQQRRIPGPMLPLHVLHTKPRQEKALLEQMHAIGLWSYLPLLDSIRYHGRRKARVAIPLFPGYLFIRGPRDDAFRADRTGRVVSIVSVPDQDQLERELWSIWRVLSAGGAPQGCTAPVCGTPVEVTAGPFAGIQGVVDESRSQDRLVMKVDLIGGAADLEIDRALLSRIDS